MAYCKYEDIQRLLPTVVGSSAFANDGRVSEDQINKIIEQISFQMDQRFLRKGWSIPIDTSLSPRIESELNRIASDGVAAIILRSVYEDGSVNFQLAETKESQYYGDLKYLVECGLGPEYDSIPCSDNVIIESEPSKLISYV